MIEKTYEMNWDCEYCGAKKLLGVTHRFCPECGAQQNPQKRYFPPDNEKVAVQDHQYVGADVHCPSCTHAQSAAVKHCTNCGGPMSGGAAAHRAADQVMGPGGMPMPATPPQQQQKKGGNKIIIIVGALVGVVLLAVILLAIFWKKEAAVEVTNHTWKREINIERYDEFKETGNCNSKPAGAKVINRKKGQKKCKTRKVDQGDGTFKEKQECTQQPDQCTYKVKKWKQVRVAKKEGKIDDEPRWPQAKLKRKGTCVGCEREGSRNESYIVHFKDHLDGEKVSCSFGSQGPWKKYEVGSKFKGEKSALTGALDCDSLKAE